MAHKLAAQTVGSRYYEIDGDSLSTAVEVEIDPELVEAYHRVKAEFDTINCKLEIIWQEKFYG